MSNKSCPISFSLYKMNKTFWTFSDKVTLTIDIFCCCSKSSFSTHHSQSPKIFYFRPNIEPSLYKLHCVYLYSTRLCIVSNYEYRTDERSVKDSFLMDLLHIQ